METLKLYPIRTLPAHFGKVGQNLFVCGVILPHIQASTDQYDTTHSALSILAILTLPSADEDYGA